MLISPTRQCLILRLRDPSTVTSLIPKSKVFTHQGKEFVAVKHGVDEVKVLRNIGINAPSPIKHYYDFPGRFKPFYAQRETADFLTSHGRAFCLNDLGTGKTLASLWAYDYLRSKGIVKKALVISPLSTLERTWADEIWQNFPHLECAVVYGSSEKRIKMLNQDADIYLINHDGLKVAGVVEALAKRADIDLVILDEISQVARNAGTDRYRSLNTVINKQVPRRCWGMSGTPIPNKPTDAWAQCRLLVPDRVPAYFNRFRDTVERQVTQFLWVPRANALDIVHEAMQPAIRFSRDDCVDLPPCMYVTRHVELTSPQKKAYKDMMNKLKAEVDSGEVTAVNEAVKAQKLIQIACLCYDTPVLTSDGWVPIQNVTDLHKVWDGVEWVSQNGSIYKGFKPVVSVDGVLMTDDHKVLTVSGWATAKEILNGEPSEGLSRAEVRLPDGYSKSRNDNGVRSVRDVVVPMRLRSGGSSKESVPANKASHYSTELRVPSRERNAQDVQLGSVQHLGEDEATLLESFGQRLEELRRSWDRGVRTVARVVREFLSRYGNWICERFDSGSHQQRRTLFSGKLQMGHYGAAGFQPTHERGHTNSARGHDPDTSSRSVQVESSNTARQNIPVQVGCSTGADRTYDLVDCGPRNRFVVRGEHDQLLIVHNCGSLYGDDREVLTVDAGPRMEVVREVVEECANKVIVFVPFISVVETVSGFLKEAGFSVECIHGSVSKTERDRIFTAFQKTSEPKVLVAQPAAMSHGLTLTAASTIVWYAPITSADTFVQANGRITRPSQTNNQLIVMVEGSEIERRYYDRLGRKQKVQGTLLDMVKEGAVL